MNLGRNARTLLYLLLITDLGFIGLHLIYSFGVFPDSLFSVADPGEKKALFSMLAIDRDRSYAELFGYMQMAWIVMLLGTLIFKRSMALYLGWTLLFLYFLLDDSMSLHEHFGHMLDVGLSLPSVFGLRSQDLGELLSCALIAAIIFPLIAIGYWLSDKENRQVTHHLMTSVILLVACGMGVDMLHEALPGDLIWVILEDGGELVAMSLALSVSLSIFFEPQPSTARAPAPAPVQESAKVRLAHG
ncbi:hypothetical protein [Phytohalomonas tamaricis]|uniref:hypothetical protein n=1 Tax=Phytohalomonas tamaricis TaxID=2081032 RepID=UPI000D0BDE7B|nr:hypothetical protein [Phytohalomonas tamaricis]